MQRSSLSPLSWVVVLLVAVGVVWFARGGSMGLHQSHAKQAMTGPHMSLPAHLKGVNQSKVPWKKKPDSYWKKVLSPIQYRVCRKAGTERPFTGKHLHNKKEGVFICSSCGQKLFRSKTKFKSGTGWPSFYAPYSKKAVTLKTDRSYGMVRVEVVCSRCNAHLGHVFKDGPRPTGLRYCINSVCLNHMGKKKPTKKPKKS